ncbi:MAG: GAF domain-containing protein [Desulfocapsaceae bacterium]
MKVKGFSEGGDILTRAREKESDRLRVLLPLYRFGSKLLKAETEEEICNLVGDTLQEQIGATSFSVMLLDETASCLRIVASRGIAEQVIDQVRVKPGERISGRVFDKRTPLIIDRSDNSPEDIKPLLTRKELSSSISFPLVSKKQSVGVINISQRDGDRRYNISDIELVSILAQLTVTALENIRLTREKQESARVRTLFEQYVSPDVARFLLDQGQQTVGGGTIQQLTVMFADIRNYTLLAQHLTLPALHEFLNDFFSMFTRVVYNNQGTLDKFMGDGALVIFGAPLAHQNPCEAALCTGKEAIAAFRTLRNSYVARDTIFAEIGLGIGISCGEMFLGNLGSKERFDYTVIGPDVNIAQRLASGTDGDRVFCTDTVLKDQKQKVTKIGSHTMELKGFTQPVMVHEIGLDW